MPVRMCRTNQRCRVTCSKVSQLGEQVLPDRKPAGEEGDPGEATGRQVSVDGGIKVLPHLGNGQGEMVDCVLQLMAHRSKAG